MLSKQEFHALLIESWVRNGVAWPFCLPVGSDDWPVRGMHRCKGAGASLPSAAVPTCPRMSVACPGMPTKQLGSRVSFAVGDRVAAGCHRHAKVRWVEGRE